MAHTFGRPVSLSQDQAIARFTQELAKEGFGVLTEIDGEVRKRLERVLAAV